MRKKNISDKETATNKIFCFFTMKAAVIGNSLSLPNHGLPEGSTFFPLREAPSLEAILGDFSRFFPVKRVKIIPF